jgi:hypothetical protein
MTDTRSIVSVQAVKVRQVDDSGTTTAYLDHLLVTLYGGESFYTRPLGHPLCAYEGQIQDWIDAGGAIT